MQYFRVKNWEKFQHYKDRNPPWIKLHFELLASEDWVTLADASRVLLIACMLIASKNAGMVPNNPAYLRRVGYLNSEPNFKPLIECGFLEKVLAPASGMQAEASKSQAEFRPETETYREETEKESIEEGSLRSPSSAADDKNHRQLDKRSSKSKKPKIEYDIEAKAFLNLGDKIALWEKTFPAVNVNQKLNEMIAWLDANPANRKSNYERFIVKWLTKAQDQAPRAATKANGAHPPSASMTQEERQAIIDKRRREVYGEDPQPTQAPTATPAAASSFTTIDIGEPF